MEYPDYNPNLDDRPLSDAELDDLDETLRTLPAEGAMNIEGLDGYCTGLLVGPRLIDRLQTCEWLPVVWGGDGPDGAPFKSARQRKRVSVLVLRHLHSIACRLAQDPDQWEPVFSVAEDEGVECVDAEDWCIGFLHAVALRPDEWEPLFDGPQTGQALVPVALLGAEECALGEADRARLADVQARDDLSRAVVDAVLLLNRRAPGQEE
ncbi:MAG TPA: UPF0149 family protein [Burkholderiaceae bacterium]|nr:UPF0149 family protein [Burkholderiaceae bacterium]